METLEQQEVEKKLNALGTLYESATNFKQLEFREALRIFSKRDKTDYYRAFRDVWKYSDTIGKAPFAIVACAVNVLNYKPFNEPKP